jgi:hypothetical protein
MSVKGEKIMGKRLIQAATITCMLFLVVEIGSKSAAPQDSSIKVMTNDPVTMFPALKSVFQ